MEKLPMRYILLLAYILMAGCSSTVDNVNRAAESEFNYQMRKTVRDAIDDAFDNARDRWEY